jgi:hypothetical protein
MMFVMTQTDSRPTLQEQLALGQTLLRFLVRANSKKRKPVLEFLFKELTSDSDKTVSLAPASVLRGLNEPVTQEKLSALRGIKTRLVADLDDFFNYREGNKEKWCVYFEDKDYRPRFKINIPRSSNEADYLRQFWAPHLESNYPTHILYPEPCFFEDSQNTYLRNPEAPRAENRDRFSYLSFREQPDVAYHTQLKPSHSYVPSGTVSALLHLHGAPSDLGARPNACTVSAR